MKSHAVTVQHDASTKGVTEEHENLGLAKGLSNLQEASGQIRCTSHIAITIKEAG